MTDSNKPTTDINWSTDMTKLYLSFIVTAALSLAACGESTTQPPTGGTDTTGTGGNNGVIAPWTDSKKIFVGVGWGTITNGGNLYGVAQISTDGGFTWSQTWKGSKQNTQLRDVVHGAGKFIAVGDGGIISSPDGRTWTNVNDDHSLYSIAYGGGMYVGVGETETIVYSTDGANWRKLSSVGPRGEDLIFGLDTRNHFYGVTYGEGKFIVTGSYERGLILTPGGEGLTISSDMRNTNDIGDKGRDIVYGGNNTFVIVGLTRCHTSTDGGATWTEVDAGRNESHIMLDGITYGGGKFLGVGSFGYRSVSSNGLSWTQTTNEGAMSDRWKFWNASYGNGRYIAVGSDGLTVVSKDGLTWKESVPGNGSSNKGTFIGVTYTEMP